ncbi:GNAT family N-acetyltransferase [Mycoplasmatota bacterium]|nr:GNAT family N-acetyltransferase [Mycoplasmatota bacterium]
MEYTYLKKEYINEIASILTEKYKDALVKLPILSDKYVNYDKHVERLSKFVDDNRFLVAIEDNKVVGFMKGFYIDDYKGTVKGALVLPFLTGVLKGYDKSRIYNLLYQKISDIWVEDGCYTHSILMYANEEEILDTWVYNGFGMYVIDAVRKLEKVNIPEKTDDIVIRKAKKIDLPKMNLLFKGINEHLAKAPIFLYDDEEDSYQEYYDWLEIENNHLWIAEQDDQILGYLKTNTSEINMDELDDGDTMAINGAYVIPKYRGNHIMARLLNEATDWAISKGLKRCSTDFESANYEGRNFWLKHFIPYSYAMIRRVDERIHLNKGLNN